MAQWKPWLPRPRCCRSECSDPAQLKALILAQHETLVSRATEIENLKLLILKLQWMQFGRKSEKLDRHIEQLKLRL
jgi:transposase